MTLDYRTVRAGSHQQATFPNYTPESPPCNGGLRAFSKTSAPAVSLEPLPDRADRVRLVVRQLGYRWELCPPLSPGEAEVLLRALAGEKVGFHLDLNHGWPIESERIQAAVEQIIDGWQNYLNLEGYDA